MYAILIIDDERAILNLLRTALSQKGYNVTSASCGAEGIRLYDSQRFDLVITDIRLPDMDGNAVAQHIRNSERRSTPVLAITGTPWLPDKPLFDQVLRKPFEMKTFLGSVNRLITKVARTTAC